MQNDEYNGPQCDKEYFPKRINGDKNFPVYPSFTLFSTTPVLRKPAVPSKNTHCPIQIQGEVRDKHSTCLRILFVCKGPNYHYVLYLKSACDFLDYTVKKLTFLISKHTHIHL